MSKNYGNDSQLGEIVKYISDTMKLPVMGAGGGFAPIGTEAYFDGNTAPLGWVICDGTELNIADYPDLATYYASQHGASNYYGGNGTTTFATPKRSGMPSNGAETNEEHIVSEWRETIDGVLKCKPVYEKKITMGALNITKDTDATVLDVSSYDIDVFITASIRGYESANIKWTPFGDKGAFSITTNGILRWRSNTSWAYVDSWLIIQYTKTTDSWQPVQEGHSADGNGVFCVKATVSGDANAHQYSTEEQIVGTTEDGEVVYEKTIKFDDKSFSSGSDTNVPHGVSNIGESWINRLIWRDNDGTSRPMIPYCDGNLNSRIVFRSITSTNIVFRTNGDSWSSSDYDYVKVTIRYTKTSS